MHSMHMAALETGIVPVNWSEDIPRNIDYYLERTSNGSSLSYVVHSWVAVRRNRRHSWRLFEEALKTDYE